MARKKPNIEAIAAAKLDPGAGTPEMHQLSSNRGVTRCERLTDSIVGAYDEIISGCSAEKGDQLQESVNRSLDGLRRLTTDAERTPAMSRAFERSLTSLTGCIAKLWKETTQVYRELQIANALTAELEEKLAGIEAERAAFNIEPERAALRKAEEKTLTLRGEIAHNKKLAKSLEHFCSLSGIDLTLDLESLPAAQKNIWSDYQKVVADERSGKVRAGSSFEFYRRHKDELHKYAASVRTIEGSSK